MTPNFALLEMSHPEVASLVAAMLQARDAVERCSWSHLEEPTGEAWWADVLADPRARKRERRTDLAVKRAFYRLADEQRETILVACSKCDWRAAFARDELDRRTWCGLRDAEPAQSSGRTELQQAGLPLGPLRRALRRANRGRAVARPYHESAAVPVGQRGCGRCSSDTTRIAPDPRLRRDARGRDGSVRQELAGL
jgi:hypothetical protein